MGIMGILVGDEQNQLGEEQNSNDIPLLMFGKYLTNCAHDSIVRFPLFDGRYCYLNHC